MNILLQNERSRNYVERGGGWTPRAEQARVFATGLEAILFCYEHHFANMRIWGEFTDARMNFTVPVTDRRGE